MKFVHADDSLLNAALYFLLFTKLGKIERVPAIPFFFDFKKFLSRFLNKFYGSYLQRFRNIFSSYECFVSLLILKHYFLLVEHS